MNDFFESEDLDNRDDNIIPPDYSELDDIDDDDDDDDDDIDEEITKEDESKQEEFIEGTKFTQGIKMPAPFNTPFASTSPIGNNSPSWATGGWNQPSNAGTPSWSQYQKPSNPWNSGQSAWNQVGIQKAEINRNKRVIFCDLLDCITETYQSNGFPGLRPRDIYDFKFRFEVWQKIAAFNPEKVFIMIPQNLLPVSANGLDSWDVTLGYFCCSLSAYLRIPDTQCQVLVQSHVGQKKSAMMGSTISQLNKQGIRNEDILQVGIYSGINGLSDMDKCAASECKIDYLDLYQLLSSV